MISTEEFMRREKMVRQARRNRWYLLGLVIVVIVVVIVVSVTVTSGEKAKNQPAAARNDPAAAELLSLLEVAMKKDSMDHTTLYDETTYQAQAFNWLAKNSQLSTYDRSQVLQRFALACFYYSTNSIRTIYTTTPTPWKKSTNWLTDQHECQWMGLDCNARLKVNVINLEENGLSGAIPLELAFLKAHLISLDLTTNSLYIEGASWDVFRQFTNLQSLLMDDNYLSDNNGIPAVLGDCTSLKKIRLSYNLLGGELDGKVIQKLTKLTHLEIESNYLEGSIPSELGNMDRLIYLYLRRNALTFNLDFIKSGKLKSLFALWLDSNLITGTIPTQIGSLTELASLSMTNGTLTGTIPSELADIATLRRLWLYGNKLTGSIPTELASLTNLEVFEVQENNLGELKNNNLWWLCL